MIEACDLAKVCRCFHDYHNPAISNFQQTAVQMSNASTPGYKYVARPYLTKFANSIH